jgi:hypothetical protein
MVETSSTNIVEPPQPVIETDVARPATEHQEESEAAMDPPGLDNDIVILDNDIAMATGSTATAEPEIDTGEINCLLGCSVLV